VPRGHYDQQGEAIGVATERSAVEARNVTKIFGSGSDAVRALDNVSIQIRENEFFTLLGPSGCGKTTLLRLIAGFELPTEGEILLEGERVGHLPPNKRLVNTVFQSYALFPHMTVQQNIAFGLEMRGVDRGKIGPTVKEMLQLVQLAGYENRRPSQLSGGQQQRVALARALANNPKVLLLDEPLSALDLKLRQGMRDELKNLQQKTGITFVFVTHDQEEALTMSDRIAVMDRGQIQQLGNPQEIYELPVNRFVADFIGDTNFIRAQVTSLQNGQARCRGSSGLEFDCSAIETARAGGEVTLALRPEKIRLGKAERSAGAGKVVHATYVGTDTNYVVELGDASRLDVRVQNALDGHARFQIGDLVAIDVPAGGARMLVD
jgi:spermidine/putrescine transport system ATP-binding protein